ncbi:MAG TPA: amidohydrolase family protein [Acidimicrobiales bacterium]|jgi:predicted TIM-barrel fold metal-dependent hydrolase|nr:amidohydrolase family protein [Acidimicrobiales bacterium]
MTSHRVIDADGHVFEPSDLWVKGMPEELRARAPRPAPGGPPFLLVDDVEIPPRRLFPSKVKTPISEDEGERFGTAQADQFGPASQIEAMDLEGIDASVLFPSHGLVITGVDGVDPIITTAASRAYNDWLADFCLQGPGRLFGSAMIDPRDVAGAVAEARRAIEELGFVSVYLRPNPVNGLMWHDPAYEPLWSALEELDAPVCFHEGGGVLLPQVGTDRFDRHSFWHVATHPMEQQLAMVSVLMGGVAERHPGLRFGFMECGAGWLPYWMWRMDEHVEGEPHDFTDLTLTPSEYVERQCFVSIDTDEEPGVATIGHLEAARVVWGSDYPHHDSKFPNAFKTLSGLPGLGEDQLRSVVEDAPLALFGRRLAGALTVG